MRMINFDLIPARELTLTTEERDFLTCEDELPAEVVVFANGAIERGTRITDVKHETTDDN
jgi:hypothetical protein